MGVILDGCVTQYNPQFPYTYFHILKTTHPQTRIVCDQTVFMKFEEYVIILKVSQSQMIGAMSYLQTKM